MPLDPDDLSTWPTNLLRWIPIEAAESASGESAERITTLSADTLRREYSHLIRQLSPRRNAMRLGHALLLPKAE